MIKYLVITLSLFVTLIVTLPNASGFSNSPQWYNVNSKIHEYGENDNFLLCKLSEEKFGGSGKASFKIYLFIVSFGNTNDPLWKLYKYNKTNSSFNHTFFQPSEKDKNKLLQIKAKSHILSSFESRDLRNLKKEDCLLLTIQRKTGKGHLIKKDQLYVINYRKDEEILKYYDLDKFRITSHKYKMIHKNLDWPHACNYVVFDDAGMAYMKIKENPDDDCLIATSQKGPSIKRMTEDEVEVEKKNELERNANANSYKLKFKEDQKDTSNQSNTKEPFNIKKDEILNKISKSITIDGTNYRFKEGYGFIKFNTNIKLEKNFKISDEAIFTSIEQLKNKIEISQAPVILDKENLLLFIPSKRNDVILLDKKNIFKIEKAEDNIFISSKVTKCRKIDLNVFTIFSSIKDIGEKFQNLLDKNKSIIKKTIFQDSDQDYNNFIKVVNNGNNLLKKIKRHRNLGHYIEDNTGDITILSEKNYISNLQGSFFLNGNRNYILNRKLEKNLYSNAFEIKNDWGEIIKYIKTPIFGFEENYMIEILKNNLLKNYKIINSEFRYNDHKRNIEKMGLWIIFDDYADIDKYKFTENLQKIKKSQYMIDINQNFAGRQKYRIDVIRGDTINFLPDSFKLKNAHDHNRVGDIESLANLSEHENGDQNIEWELHIFLPGIRSFDVKDDIRLKIKNKLKKLNVSRLAIWEFVDKKPSKTTIYENEFSRIADKISYIHKFITLEQGVEEIKKIIL